MIASAANASPSASSHYLTDDMTNLTLAHRKTVQSWGCEDQPLFDIKCSQTFLKRRYAIFSGKKTVYCTN